MKVDMRIQARCLAALAALVLLAGPGGASGAGAGPWCTAALETLGSEPLTREDIAGRLLSQQTPPAIEFAPKRVLHVSAEAPDFGDGSEGRPYNRLQDAVNKVQPGDMILVAPGEYEPVVVRTSGTAEDPIIIAARRDGAARAVIDGTGLSFNKVRGLIAVRGASHVTVSGFRLQNAPRDGIFVEGTVEGERGIRILDNDIENTGNSAIFVAGIVMRFVTQVDEYRLFDVLVQGNRVTRTNEPRGVNEAITLGAGVDGFVIRNNHIFDTRQYGIDAKAGAINGSITDNVIHGIARHGIYLDAGSRRLANIVVERNAVFGANNGIVLAREANRDPEHPNLHNIRVRDNLVFDVNQFGIKAYRHPDDSGIGRFGEITIDANCICSIRRDGIRLGGIGDFAGRFTVADNLIFASGGTVWNRIGAEVAESEGMAGQSFVCPG